MELYDKEYFASLRERIKELDKTPFLFGLNYLVVSVIFFFVWANIIFGIASLNLLYPLLIIPFILLYSVARKGNSKSLLFVIGTMSVTVFFELFDLAYYYNMSLADSTINEFGICPICEVEDSIQLIIIISLVALILIIRKRVVTKFSLSKRNILLTIFLPSTILSLRIILFLVGSFL